MNLGSSRELLYRYTGLKQPEIGRLPGIDYTGVSVARKRLIQLLEKDRLLKKIMEQIQKALREASSCDPTCFPQAPHLDLNFYDEFYRPGAYLTTHAAHMAQWHPDNSTQVSEEPNESGRDGGEYAEHEDANRKA